MVLPEIRKYQEERKEVARNSNGRILSRDRRNWRLSIHQPV
jgi:hypothetical protein